MNTTTSSSPSKQEDGSCQDETTLLYHILQELQMLKEIVSNMVRRRQAMNSASVIGCSRSTQTECHSVAQVTDDNGSSEPLDLAVFSSAGGKRSSRALSETGGSVTPKQAKVCGRSATVGGAPGTTGSIEQAVAKIKAIRSERQHESPSASTSPSDSAADQQDRLGALMVPGGARFAACSPNSNKTPTAVDMIASAAAAVAGCYPAAINGEMAAGMFPFSPLLDSLMLSSHCAWNEAAAAAVAAADFAQAQPLPSTYHYKTMCQKGMNHRVGDAHPPPAECKTTSSCSSSCSSSNPTDAVVVERCSSNAVVPATDGSKAQKSSSFGADYYKPYACQHANCNKRFSNKFLLKKHEFIHTGERPHQCPYCCKRFNRKDNLLRHKKTHEPSNVLIKRTGRSLDFCPPTAGEEVPSAFAPFKLDPVMADPASPFGNRTVAAVVSARGCFDQDAQIMYDEEELDEEADDEDGVPEEVIKVNQESTSEKNDGTGARLTPSNNLLPSAVTSKTTSTSQLPIATSFRVTN